MRFSGCPRHSLPSFESGSSVATFAMSLYAYRVTKYDPKLRDERGRWDDWISMSDIGKTFRGRILTLDDYLDVEAKYLTALASFMAEAGVEHLQARAVEKHGDHPAPSEGQRMSLTEAIEVVREILREQIWCRLEAPDNAYIHVGYDYYVYVGSDRSVETSVLLAKRLGLFVDRDFPSPHHPEDS